MYILMAVIFGVALAMSTYQYGDGWKTVAQIGLGSIIFGLVWPIALTAILADIMSK
jgi:hypothetical protein